MIQKYSQEIHQPHTKYTMFHERVSQECSEPEREMFVVRRSVAWRGGIACLSQAFGKGFRLCPDLTDPERTAAVSLGLLYSPLIVSGVG